MSRATWLKDGGGAVLVVPRELGEQVLVVQILESRRGTVRVRLVTPENVGIATYKVGPGDASAEALDAAISVARGAAERRATAAADTDTDTDSIPF